MSVHEAPVVLVTMPFSSLTHPALGPSLLQAALRRQSIECRLLYANLFFAERVGLEAYHSYESLGHLGGELLFAEAAFLEKTPELPRQLGARLPSVVDFRLQASAFVRDTALSIVARAPKIVGCSSTFQQNCASLALLREIKRLAPEIWTVMGGANCEGVMGQTLVANFGWLDYVVSGEADEAFPALCASLLDHAGAFPPERIYGVISRKNLHEPAPRASFSRLDELPLPDYSDYFDTLEQVGFGEHIEPGLMLETSRGCWWGQKHHCTFCGLNGKGMGYRSKSADRVVTEMEHLVERYGVEGLMVADNILDMRHFQTVLPRLNERGWRLFYETKANLKQSHVQALAAAGVRWIQPGIESLSDEVLALMDKGASAHINLQLLRQCREHGIRVFWNFLVGFPGEDPQWTWAMTEFLPSLVHFQPPNGVVWIRYDRFSPYHETPEKYGVRPVAMGEYGYVYPLEADQLADLAYFFVDENGAQREPLRAPVARLRELVDEWRALWQGSAPLLNFIDDGQRLDMLDTRPGRHQSRYFLAGMERDLVLACLTPVRRELLLQRLGEGAEAALNRLIELRVVLEIHGQCLNLALAGDVPSLPSDSEFPGGTIGVASWARRYAGRPKQETVVQAEKSR